MLTYNFIPNIDSGGPALVTPPDNALAYGQVLLYYSRIVPGDLTRDFVPYYHFRIMTSCECDVGHINFRVGDTEHVQKAAGHIGFEIHEPYRGNRYALQECRAIAPFVRSLYEHISGVQTLSRPGCPPA